MRSKLFRPLLVLLLGAGLLGSAQAAPGTAETSPDPVLALLIERGLLPGSAGELVLQMRDRASDLVGSAMTFLGVPYKWGGNNAEEGFDCSGFTRFVFERSLGRVLPRRAEQQARATELVSVPREQLQPGDLVFFNTLRRTFSHVGIYVGDGKFIHAPRRGAEVRVEDMGVAFWARRFTGARRAPETVAGEVSAARSP